MSARITGKGEYRRELRRTLVVDKRLSGRLVPRSALRETATPLRQTHFFFFTDLEYGKDFILSVRVFWKRTLPMVVLTEVCTVDP